MAGDKDMIGLGSMIVKGITGLFGSSSNGKGVIQQASDVADKWIPSETSKHEMSVEDMKAGDSSQAAAQGFTPAPSHESWLDILIDAWSRAQRPAFSTWALGLLCGWWEGPRLDSIDPLTLNIIWTIVGFWFGTRMIFKDIPNAIAAFKRWRS